MKLCETIVLQIIEYFTYGNISIHLSLFFAENRQEVNSSRDFVDPQNILMGTR